MNNRRTIITVGMFDGVHWGHRFLIDQLDNLAKELNMIPAVISFDKHPLKFIKPEKAPELIMTPSVKQAFLEIGSTKRKIYIIKSEPEIFELTAREFILLLKKIVNVKAILLGYNNGFGSDLVNTPEKLREALKGTGIEVYEAPKYDGEEVSSSAIREAIKKGDMKKAKRMLGTTFFMEGTVVKGQQIGRQLGFPTANIEINEDMIVPGNGVYAAICYGCPTMLNIGTAPTIRHNGGITIEAHIITEHQLSNKKVNIPNLYGKKLEIVIVEKIREECKFDDTEKLKEQLEKDRKDTIEKIHNFCNSSIEKCR